MKFFKNFSKILILILLLNISIFYEAKLSNNIKSLSKQDDIKKIWTEIFSKPQGENCIALTPKQLEDEKKIDAEKESGVSWSGPRKKTNRFDKQQGFGTSAYFFDYIDDIFQEDISKEFQRVFDEVKKLTPDSKEYTDPYPLSKLISAFSTDKLVVPNADAKADASNDQALLDKLKSITKQNNKIFNENSYKNSVTAANIYKACKDFQWNYNQNEVDWAKKIVDRYDFDGDGRLNPREFVMMTIIHNENILGSTTSKNCYNDIISKKIDPIFKFLDCNNDNKISAEDIWENFGSLKRKTPGKANIYSCVIRNEKYRTNSVNDFFIKNMKSFDGFLNKEEFRRAILLGYWDRHTDVEKIYPDETRTFKQLRWGASGDTDIVCDRINNANNPAPPAENQNKPPNAKDSRAKDYFFRRH